MRSQAIAPTGLRDCFLHRGGAIIEAQFPALGHAMPVALEKFVKQLADSGIIAPGKLENFIPPKASPKDAEELARQLVRAST